MARKRTPTRRSPRAKPEAGAPEDYLVASLRQLEDMARDAEEAESYTAAVQAKAKAIQVRADLDRLRETRKRQDVPESRSDHKAELLAGVRRLRVGAEEAGSFVAAAKLLQLEREFVSLAEAEERQAREDAKKNRTADELRAEIERLRAQDPTRRAH